VPEITLSTIDNGIVCVEAITRSVPKRGVELRFERGLEKTGWNDPPKLRSVYSSAYTFTSDEAKRLVKLIVGDEIGRIRLSTLDWPRVSLGVTISTGNGVALEFQNSELESMWDLSYDFSEYLVSWTTYTFTPDEAKQLVKAIAASC